MQERKLRNDMNDNDKLRNDKKWYDMKRRYYKI